MGAVVPVAGVPNVDDPNVGSCELPCPNPNPPKPVVVVDVVVPNAVPKPVAKKLLKCPLIHKTRLLVFSEKYPS